mgnify:CR=1 FL=1
MRVAALVLLLAWPGPVRAETRVEGCTAADAVAIAELVDLELDALALPEAPDVRVECRGARLLASVRVGERRRELDFDEGPDARRALALEVAETAAILAEPEPEAGEPEPEPEPSEPPPRARRVHVGAGAEAAFDGNAVGAGGLVALDLILLPARLELRVAGRALAIRQEGPGRRGEAGLGLSFLFGRPDGLLRGALELIGWVGARRVDLNGQDDRAVSAGASLTPWLRLGRAVGTSVHLGVRLWIGRRLDVFASGDRPERGALWALGPALLLVL